MSPLTEAPARAARRTPTGTPRCVRPAEPGDTVQHGGRCPALDHGTCLCGLVGDTR